MTLDPDRYPNRTGGVTDPPSSLYEITPSDTELLDPYVRGMYVGVGGDVTVTGVGDTDSVTYLNVPQGATLIGRFKKVHATGTTATNLIGLV